MSLYECTRAVFGREIEEGWRRFSKKAWRHLGDTGIPAGGGKTLHAFLGEWVQRDGTLRKDTVVADPVSNRGLDPIRLPPEAKDRFNAWLETL